MTKSFFYTARNSPCPPMPSPLEGRLLARRYNHQDIPAAWCAIGAIGFIKTYDDVVVPREVNYPDVSPAMGWAVEDDGHGHQ